MSIADSEFMVLDVETTGLSSETDRVVEIAIIRGNLHETISRYEMMVNPEMAIPPQASAIHHITDAMVSDSPTFSEVMEDIQLKFPDSIPVFAHNSHFDKGFLPDLSHRRWGCTMRMAKHLWPYESGYSNQYLRYSKGLNVSNGSVPHSAIGDVEVTYQLLKLGIKTYLEEGMGSSMAEFLTYCHSPIRHKTLNFGKHKGKSIEDVIENDINYIYWLLDKYDGLDKDLRASIMDYIG